MGGVLSREWGEGHDTCTVTDVIRWAQTGDLILFAGVGGASDFIRCTSPASAWSHVGVVVRIGGKLRITEAYKDVISIDVIRGESHDGVQTVDLEARLRTYEGGRVAWRSVRCTNGRMVSQARIAAFVERMRAYPSDMVPRYCPSWRLWDMIEFGERIDNDDDRDKNGREFFVCTSWSATVWQMFGIYRADLDTGKLLLADVGMPYMSPVLTSGWQADSINFVVQ